jgi:hypothetical protein
MEEPVMTSMLPIGKFRAVLDSFLAAEERYEAAVRTDDIPEANRQMTKIITYGDRLAASGPEGREALEAMLDDASPYLRLRSARRVLAWAPQRAIPVLGRLLFEDLGGDRSAAERIDIRVSAKDCLYLHFGIKSWRQNDLIAPLRTYGVDLPYEDEAKWT